MFNKKQRAQKYAVGGKVSRLFTLLTDIHNAIHDIHSS